MHHITSALQIKKRERERMAEEEKRYDRCSEHPPTSLIMGHVLIVKKLIDLTCA